MVGPENWGDICAKLFGRNLSSPFIPCHIYSYILAEYVRGGQGVICFLCMFVFPAYVAFVMSLPRGQGQEGGSFLWTHFSKGDGRFEL